MATRVKLSRKQTVVGLLILSLGLVGYELYSAAEAVEARSWESASAKITESRMRHGRYRNRSRSIAIAYEYQYAGKRYIGNKVDFGGIGQYVSCFGFDLSGILQKYPKGQQVTVYVDPQAPHRAVIDRSFPMSAAIALGLGVAMATGIIGNFIVRPT